MGQVTHEAGGTRWRTLALREKERQRGDDVDAAEHRALQPVGLAVEGDKPGDQDCRAQSAELQRGEDEPQGVAQERPQKDEDRGHEEGYLDGGAKGDRHREVHLVLVGDLYAYYVLGDVPDYGHDYDPDEELGDPHLHHQRLYGPDECLGYVGDGG